MTKTKTCEICHDEDDVATFHVEVIDHDEREQHTDTMNLCHDHGHQGGFWHHGLDITVLDEA